MDNDMFDCLLEACDTFILIEEKDRVKDVAEAAEKNYLEFFKQVEKRISTCENECQKDFMYQVTMTFLMSSLFKVIEIQNSEGRLIENFSKIFSLYFQKRLEKIQGPSK